MTIAALTWSDADASVSGTEPHMLARDELRVSGGGRSEPVALLHP
jgi:hypothetical protein